MGLSIGGYSTLLFVMGLVITVSACLQIAAFAKLPILVRIVSCMTLGPISLFTLCDLSGMIVLRSRMWRHMSRPGNTKSYIYDGGSDVSSIRWWQKWVCLEDIVFRAQLYLPYFRMACSMILMVSWTACIMQLAYWAGRCDEEKKVCRLLKLELVGMVVGWVALTVVCLVLIVLNTSRTNGPSPARAMLPLARAILLSNAANSQANPATAPSSGAAAAAAAAAAATATAAATSTRTVPVAPSATVPATPAMPPHFPPLQAHQQYMYQHHPHLNNMQIYQQRYHPTWGPSASTSSSTLSRTQHDLYLQSQNMMQQFYHLQNQQFQSLNQFQPSSRISEEDLDAESSRRKSKLTMSRFFRSRGTTNASSWVEPAANQQQREKSPEVPSNNNNNNNNNKPNRTSGSLASLTGNQHTPNRPAVTNIPPLQPPMQKPPPKNTKANKRNTIG